MPELKFEFSSAEQESAFYLQKKHQCICGGYGSGKTFVSVLKFILLCQEFPGYRVAMIRRERLVLYKTTYQTFCNIIGDAWDMLIENDNKQDGTTTFKNGSKIFWLGLDKFDVNDLKSLELNSAFMDQGEEMDEVIFTHLKARLDRWSGVEVPEKYWKDNPTWRRNPFTKKPMAPCYNIVVCNPDLETHWIWKEFHPDSLWWQEKNRHDHDYIVIPSTANGALSPDNLAEMMKNDPVWVRRFVFGEWGNSDAQIHTVRDSNIIEPSKEWLENLLGKAILYRSYDHGDSSPSCCLWNAIYKGQYFIYREYYMPDKLISYHRQAIADLSPAEENYEGSYADPDIFKKKSQNAGGRYALADEYKDRSLCSALPILWRPADNNELGTRNRISELLRDHDESIHPISGHKGAPLLYFIKRNEDHPNGCFNVIMQTKSQRREKLEEINGKPVYSDERDKRVVDHAYDALRYFVALHRKHDPKKQVKLNPNSFNSLLGKFERRHATQRRYF